MRSVLERLDQLWTLAERGTDVEATPALMAKGSDAVIRVQGVLISSIGLHAASRADDVQLAAAHIQAFEALAFVGDGATDLEAAPAAERFVAFGGVERRARVLAAARVRCLEPDFRCLAPLLFSSAELAGLADSDAHRALVRMPASPVPPTA